MGVILGYIMGLIDGNKKKKTTARTKKKLCAKNVFASEHKIIENKLNVGFIYILVHIDLF